MGAIALGPVTVDLPSTFAAGSCLLNTDNPASGAGNLQTVDIKIGGLTAVGVIVGVFYTTGANTWVARATQAMGNLAAGTHTGLSVDLDFEASDIIGYYSASGGTITRATSGYQGIWYVNNNNPLSAPTEMTFYDGDAVGIRGDGVSSGGNGETTVICMGAKSLALGIL